MARSQTESLLPVLLLLLLPSVLLLTLSTFPPLCTGAAEALVSPITKDPLSNLYTIPLGGPRPLLLDIGGPLLWSACPAAAYPTVPCKTRTCVVAHAFPSPLCPRFVRPPGSPCACYAATVNPITRKCAISHLTLTNLTVTATNGKNPTGPVTVHGVASSCASPTVLKSLPAGAVGVAGLARSGLALPTQLASKLSFKRQFSICLPSTAGSPGVAFFGNKPFYLLPPPGIDVTARLTYTKLKKNKMSPGYFLSLSGIAVNLQTVQFLERVLEFDSLGHGGVKLSTAVPYTTMRSHIYRPFLRAYARATRGIPRAGKVAPFDLCLESSALGSTRMGYGVPQIDLMLDEGKNWTIFGANSFKQVDAGTACLAFVDGGAKAEQAVVVGAYQMEDNFLLFNVAKSRLGFSSSLLGIRTTCSNFNFTAAGIV